MTDDRIATGRIEPITERQREVARLIAEGRTNPEIAEALGISLAGAKYHVSELLGRLGLQHREEIGDWYRREAALAEPGGWRRVRGLVAMPAAWMLGGALVVAAVGLLYAGLNGARVAEPGDTTPALGGPAAEPAEVVGARGEPSHVERLPVFLEYEVQEGDTIDSIAARFGLDRTSVLWNNLHAVSGSTEPGPNQFVVWLNSIAFDPADPPTLRVPTADGILHAVRADETVDEIATHYGAEPRDTLDFPANGLDGDPDNLRPDTIILVPGGTLLPPGVPTSGGDSPTSRAGDGDWLWPLQGRLVGLFSPEHPLGIDIAVEVGTPVVAANGGTAIYVGGDPCCSYGFHVVIDHGNGYESIYAHLDAFNVFSGQQVEAGDVIGWSGDTGRIEDEPILHLEIRRDGVHQDPLNYLP